MISLITMAENDPILSAVAEEQTGNYNAIANNGLTHTTEESEGYLVFATKLAINIILHTLVIGFTIFIISLSLVDPVHLFTFHPICMTSGFFFFTTNAIFAQSKHNVVSFRFHHQSRIVLHWILQAASVILMTVGFVLIIVTVNRDPKKPPHFYTNHSILGLTTYVLMCTSTLGGVATLYKHKFRAFLTARQFKIAHSALGLITYTLGTAALCLALFTHWFEKYCGESTIWTCFVIIVSVWAYAISRPLWSLKSRLGF